MPLSFPEIPDGPGGVDILMVWKGVADEEFGRLDSGVSSRYFEDILRRRMSSIDCN